MYSSQPIEVQSISPDHNNNARYGKIKQGRAEQSRREGRGKDGHGGKGIDQRMEA